MMKLSSINIIRIIVWTTLIAAFAINYFEKFNHPLLNILLVGIIFLGIVFFCYHFIINISILLTNLIKNRNVTLAGTQVALERSGSKLVLPMLNETKYIDHEDIVRCEADNNYTAFHLTNNEKILIAKPLKVYADLLSANGFIRTHQSHLVNPAFVKSWLKKDGGILLLASGDKIPISKPNKEIVKQALQQL